MFTAFGIGRNGWALAGSEFLSFDLRQRRLLKEQAYHWLRSGSGMAGFGDIAVALLPLYHLAGHCSTRDTSHYLLVYIEIVRCKYSMETIS